MEIFRLVSLKAGLQSLQKSCDKRLLSPRHKKSAEREVANRFVQKQIAEKLVAEKPSRRDFKIENWPAMSGTVLSTLCSICHTESTKYKCPRCGARTCSVQCVQKHKARADCDGIRNPRAFMPLSQLKTDSGIDHDFNFLTSIERARQRAEKDIVEARQLLSEKELRPRDEDKLFRKVWQGDELRHVPVQPQSYKKNGRPQEALTAIDGFDKHVRRRLRYLDIEAITMPKGMARQRENKTAFNRRTQTINWQVEWLVYSASDLGFPASQDHQQPLRILYKTLEGTPLNTALATTLDWHRGQLDRQSREQQQGLIESDDEADPGADESPQKKRKTHHGSSGGNKKPQPAPSPTQDPATNTWPAAAYTAQYPLTTSWSQTTTAPHTETTLEETLGQWQFYLVKAVAATATSDASSLSKKNKTLIPLRSTESLTSALQGRTVVEFPTVLALPRGLAVPAGHVVGSGERRAPPPSAAATGERAGGRGEGNDHSGGGSNRKRGFEGGQRDRGWDLTRDGDRGRGQGGYGRGGKRARFDARRPHPPRGSVKEAAPQREAEEGEVDSEGDEVMGGADGRSAGKVMDVDEEDEGGSSVTLAEEEEDGEVRDEPVGGRPRGGLVDYGSSDESD